MYAQRSTAIAFAICWAISILLLWVLHRQWWKIRGVRRALWIVPILEALSIGLWIAFSRAHNVVGTMMFASLSGFGVTAALGIMLSLPFSGITLSLERLFCWIARRRRRTAAASSMHAVSTPAHSTVAPRTAPALAAEGAATRAEHVSDEPAIDAGRRSFITKAAAVFPAITVAAAGGGVLASYGPTRFPNVPLAYPGLPRALEGLRILHLSDVHLGYFIGLDDLEQTMIGAEAQRPDIVLVTGDLADDLTVLPEAIRMIDALKPRLGTFASIGNHEYYRGIGEVLAAFEKGPIPMLIDEATAVTVGGTRLVIAGADDPASTGRFNDNDFMRATVDRSLDGTSSDAFTILLSHRPEGFDYAAPLGVDLTLSGHYHGGIQLGLNGRAIIQGFRPEVHYWGHYRKGDAQLYTSGGVGHWFPFRLACPPEAPVYVLRGRA